MKIQQTILGLALLLGAGIAESATPTFAVTMLAPPAGFIALQAQQVNDDGDLLLLALNPDSERSYFLWTLADGFASITTPDDSKVTAVDGLNNHEAIIGRTLTQAFFWSPSKGARTIDPLGGYSNVVPRSINEKDVVVGSVIGTSDGRSHAFTWTPQAGMSVRGQDRSSEAVSINNKGDVAANVFYRQRKTRAILFDGSGVNVLKPSFVEAQTEAVAVNGHDTVALNAILPLTGIAAYSWTVKRGFEQVGDLPNTIAIGIDNIGEIVGLQAAGAFVWSKSYGYAMIGNLLATGSPQISEIFPTSISKKGIIAGSARDVDQVLNALILTPLRARN